MLTALFNAVLMLRLLTLGKEQHSSYLPHMLFEQFVVQTNEMFAKPNFVFVVSFCLEAVCQRASQTTLVYMLVATCIAGRCVSRFIVVMARHTLLSPL